MIIGWVWSIVLLIVNIVLIAIKQDDYTRADSG